jgi:hypothetical protein
MATIAALLASVVHKMFAKGGKRLETIAIKIMSAAATFALATHPMCQRILNWLMGQPSTFHKMV